MFISPMMYVAAFQPENEYITKTSPIANGPLTIWARSLGCGVNAIGWGTPMMKPATRKATISTTFRMVELSWKVEECLTPVNCTIETSHTTPLASRIGDSPGTTDLAYSPNAIAASATGAAKPTIEATQPATKPKAG